MLQKKTQGALFVYCTILKKKEGFKKKKKKKKKNSKKPQLQEGCLAFFIEIVKKKNATLFCAYPFHPFSFFQIAGRKGRSM